MNSPDAQELLRLIRQRERYLKSWDLKISDQREEKVAKIEALKARLEEITKEEANV